MAYFEFPHTRTYDGDLGFVIKKLIELTEHYDMFFKYNSIKFADPLQWDITKQYEAYTIVFDYDSGYSYISKQPVPAGIGLNNPDFWCLVGPLIIDSWARTEILTILSFIANIYETGTTATAVRNPDDFVVVNGALYQVTSLINIGETYTSGYNITPTTIENMILFYIEKSFYVTPEMFGAIGDGVNNDWEAIQRAVDHCQDLGAGVVVFTTGKTYMIDQAICIAKDNITILGYGATIKRTGLPGYYGDVLDVFGLRNGLDYYGVNDDYSTRDTYTGPTTPSNNINVLGVNIICDGTSGAMNGIGVVNAKNVLIKDCIIDNIPKCSYVAISTADMSAEATFDNCISLNANGHGFRTTAYDTTDPDNTFIININNCTEKGSLGTAGNEETPQAAGFICGLYLNGETLDKNCKISANNCLFEHGIIQAGVTGVFNFYNVTAQFYYGYASASTPSTTSVENIINCVFTGYANNTYQNAIRIVNKHEINIINTVHSLDKSYKALSIVSPEKLIIDNVSDGALEVYRDRNTESHITISNTRITSDSRLSLNTFANGSVELDNCIIDFADSFDYFSGHADTDYIVHDCTLNRSNTTNGYNIIRNIAQGNLHDNKLILTGTAPNTERVATASANISVYNNRITQTDNIQLIDYGGRCAGAPTDGRRFKGEYTIESAPTAGGYFGYVCTTSGNPGTWKGYGLIEA